MFYIVCVMSLVFLILSDATICTKTISIEFSSHRKCYFHDGSIEIIDDKEKK